MNHANATLRGGALLPVLRVVLVVGIAAALFAPLVYVPPSGIVSPEAGMLVLAIATATLALVAFGLLLGLTATRHGPSSAHGQREARAAHPRTATAFSERRPLRPGAGHHILELGVGRRHSILLNEHGIVTTRDLAHADVGELARLTGVEPARAEDWQAAARLLEVPGVGSHDAVRLVRHGVRTPGQLAGHDATTLARRLGTEPGTTRRWITAAERGEGVRMEREPMERREVERHEVVRER